MSFGNKVVYRAISSEIIIEKLNTANNIALNDSWSGKGFHFLFISDFLLRNLANVSQFRVLQIGMSSKIHPGAFTKR